MYNTVNQLSTDTASYLAGLVDGEGSVCLSKVGKLENRTAVLVITNTDKPLLDWVKLQVGCGSIHKQTKYKSHHLQSYEFVVSHRQAINLLRQISMYLKTYKSRRASLLIEYFHTKNMVARNGKPTDLQRQHRLELEQKFVAIKPFSS